LRINFCEAIILKACKVIAVSAKNTPKKAEIKSLKKTKQEVK
jgi:hypothetical protein